MKTEEYKEKLSSELTLITEELRMIAHLNETTGDWEAVPEAPAETSDDNVTADAAEDSAERQAMVSDLETRYRNISLAIKKFETGSYGVCELCQKEIEEARLDANPAARTCIEDRERGAELSL